MLDGAKGLKEKLEPLFPNAIITLDVCHVVEKLWELGHRFHKEGSEELKAWVEELKELVYQGRAATLVKRLQTLLKQVPMHGPGTKGRRQALKKLIGYLEPAIEDDAISQMDIGGLGHCQWSSGRRRCGTLLANGWIAPACVGYLNVPKRCCTCSISS